MGGCHRITAMNDDDGHHDHDGDCKGARSMSLLLTSYHMINIMIVMEDGDTDSDGHKTSELVRQSYLCCFDAVIFVSVIVFIVPLVKEEGMLESVIITIHESIMIMGMTF